MRVCGGVPPVRTPEYGYLPANLSGAPRSLVRFSEVRAYTIARLLKFRSLEASAAGVKITNQSTALRSTVGLIEVERLLK